MCSYFGTDPGDLTPEEMFGREPIPVPRPSEPLPCPFCGSKAVMNTTGAGCTNTECDAHLANVYLRTWNRRSPSVPTATPSDGINRLRDTLSRLEKSLAGSISERETLTKELGVLTGRQVSDCPCCGEPGTLIKDDAHEVSWGGARGGDDVGITVTIKDEWTGCDKCGDEWYTFDQSSRHSRQIAKAVEAYMRETIASLTTEKAALESRYVTDTTALRSVVESLTREQQLLQDQLAESMALQAKATSLVQQQTERREQAIQDIEALPTFRVGKAGGLPEAVSRSAVLSIVRGSAK